MGRYPRWHPPTERESTLVEITSRVIQGRALLRPSTLLNRRVLGVIGRAQRLYDVEIHALGFLSNHDHPLCSFDDVEQQARFMCHVQTNLSKEVGRLHDWPGPMWERRYRGIPVSEEAVAQVSRLRYVLAQGCKEGLVGSPLEWPGVSSAWHLWHGEREMEGEWVDRTALYEARRTKRGARATEEDFTSIEKVRLSPIPCMEHLGWDEYCTWVRDLIVEIEEETKARHRANGTRPLGAEKIVSRPPGCRPEGVDRSPAPAYHCASKSARKAFWRALREFMEHYREAAERLRRGELAVVFPSGCYTPRRQFVARVSEPEPRARAPGTV